MLDLLEDLFGDLIFKGLEKGYKGLSDYSAVHPRKAAYGKVFLLLIAAGGAVVWFAFRAYLGWKAEDTLEMWIYVTAAGVLLFVYVFIGLRRFLHWRKLRAERMYDPRYQE